VNSPKMYQNIVGKSCFMDGGLNQGAAYPPTWHFIVK